MKNIDTQQLDARNIFILPVLVFALGACSTSRQPYFFSTYSVNDKAPFSNQESTLKIEQELGDTPAEKSYNQETKLPLDEQEFPILKTDSFKNKTTAKKISTQDTIKGNHPKKLKKKDEMKGDKKKNKFAVLGYIFAFATPVIALLMFPFGMFMMAIPTLLLGVIFSAVGLESEKRELAKDALWILALVSILGAIGFLYIIATL